MRSKYYFLPTWKLKEILDHPHTQGVNGKDYGPVKEELEDILWERQGKEEHDEPEDAPEIDEHKEDERMRREENLK